jgi:hypothetical protein
VDGMRPSAREDAMGGGERRSGGQMAEGGEGGNGGGKWI